MKKNLVTMAASLALTIGISTLATYKSYSLQDTTALGNQPSVENQVLEQSITTALVAQTAPQENIETKVESSEKVNNAAQTEIKPVENTSTTKDPTTAKSTSSKSTSSAVKKANTVSKADTKPKQPLSRGGSAIPSHNVTYTGTSKFGELLSWNQASSLIPRGSTIKATDLSTGKTFDIKRTFGSNHLDGEASSLSDTNIIKSIWGGFSWARRPVIVSINGRNIAASMTAMPHAGVDSAPTLANVSNRSDGYGTGENLDAVKNNGMDGVIDIHFLNSTRHKDNRPDSQHQAAILKAAGK